MTGKSEFATLSDLAIAKGVSHSQLISDINDRVYLEYRKLYPKTQTVEVVVNEITGAVKLMHDREDVTPDDFNQIAEKIAREVIIAKLSEAKDESALKETEEKLIIVSKEKPQNHAGRSMISFVFWGYNLLYVFVLSILLFNFLVNSEYRSSLIELVSQIGIFSASFLAIALAVPIVAIILAYKFAGFKTNERLGQLFFFFEVPVVLGALMLSNLSATPTPVMWFFYLNIIAGIPVFLTYILNLQFESVKAKIISLLLRQTVAVTVVYIILLFSFITPIILGYIGQGISEYFISDIFGKGPGYRYPINPIEIFVTIIFGGLFLFIILAIIAVPYILAIATVKMFLSAYNSLKENLAAEKLLHITSVFAVLWFIVFAISSYQPNPDRYIEKLEKLGSAQTFEEKEELAKELMPQENKIKRVFEDLRNVRQRYFWAKSDDIIVREYINALNFSDTSAEMVEQTFKLLAYPFIYQGSLDKKFQAVASFEYLFGNEFKKITPVQTNNVELLYRKISAVTDYDNTLATVTIEEEYKSMSSATRDQEVIYEFSLPPDSAVVDLKLGPELEFQGIIAPKGAAAKVYQEEVNRNRDPALLEQTGPNQYRLSIFPIPGVRSNILLGKNQKVQFSYVTVITPKGYPLPAYSREQNLKINSDRITATVNNESAQIENGNVTNNTIEKAVEAICTKNETINARSRLGQSSISLTPNIALEELKDKIKCVKGNLFLAEATQGLNFAVLLDVSYANRGNKSIKQFTNYINENEGLLKSNSVFIYKFNDILSKPVKLTAENKNDVLNNTFFGSGDFINMISSITESYDFAVVITGEDAPTKIYVNIGTAYPVYIIHDGNIPPYARDITRPLLQGGGYVYSDFANAFNKAVITAKSAKSSEGRELIATGLNFNYYSETNKNEFISAGWDTISTGPDPAAKLAAKKISDAKIASQPGNFEAQLDFLDSLNAYATRNSIVTPYSSMIALVNEQQMQNLKRQAQSYDRYQEQTRNTFNFIEPAPIPLRGGGLGSTFFGADIQNLEMAPQSEAIRNFALPGGGFAAQQSSGLGLFSSGLLSVFIIANGFLVSIGVIVFVIKKVRSKKISN
jgi:putative PEP-CTERM system integral membrane protein